MEQHAMKNQAPTPANGWLSILLTVAIVCTFVGHPDVRAADEETRRKALLGKTENAGSRLRWKGEQLGHATTMTMDTRFGELNPDVKKAFDQIEPLILKAKAHLKAVREDPPRDKRAQHEALLVADRCARLVNEFNALHRQRCIKRLSVLTRHLGEVNTDKLVGEYRKKLALLVAQADALNTVSSEISANADDFNRGSYQPKWSRLRRESPGEIVASVQRIVESAVRYPLPGQTPEQTVTTILSGMITNLQGQLQGFEEAIGSTTKRLRGDEQKLIAEILCCGQALCHVETTARNAALLAEERKMLEQIFARVNAVNANFDNTKPGQ
jgi:hypothetical protein